MISAKYLLALVAAVIAVSAAHGRVLNQADPPTSGEPILGAYPGPHPGYFKYKGSREPLFDETFSSSAGGSWGVCTQLAQKYKLNSSNMKGNIYHYNDGSFRCMGFNNDLGVVLVKTGDVNWETFKGNVAMV